MDNDRKTLQKLVRYSLLASIAILLQISVVFFPGLGTMLGPFNTLPIALAAYISPRGGLFCYVVATWLTLTIVPTEVPILALCTGPLGIALGWGLHRSLPRTAVILTGAAMFTTGMFLITKLLGVPFFAFAAGRGFTTMLLIYAGFSLVYSYAWIGVVERVVRQLGRMGVRL